MLTTLGCLGPPDPTNSSVKESLNRGVPELRLRIPVGSRVPGHPGVVSIQGRFLARPTNHKGVMPGGSCRFEERCRKVSDTHRRGIQPAFVCLETQLPPARAPNLAFRLAAFSNVRLSSKSDPPGSETTQFRRVRFKHRTQ